MRSEPKFLSNYQFSRIENAGSIIDFSTRLSTEEMDGQTVLTLRRTSEPERSMRTVRPQRLTGFTSTTRLRPSLIP